MSAAMADGPDDSRALIEHVRRVDHDRYLCALFAPAARRLDLLALIAFNHEIARVRETVSEPMLGRIRLQWWREAIDGLYGGVARRHELAVPLGRAIERHGLSRVYIDALIDGRERDLDDAPFEDMAALEAYATATATPLGALFAEVLGGDTTAIEGARAAHVAFALVGLMRAVPFHAAHGRVHLPLDRLRAHGIGVAEILAGRFSAPLGATIAEVLARAEEPLMVTRAASSQVPRPVRAAFLPAKLAAIYCARLAGVGHDPYAPSLAPGPLRKQFALWAACWTGRV